MHYGVSISSVIRKLAGRTRQCGASRVKHSAAIERVLERRVRALGSDAQVVSELVEAESRTLATPVPSGVGQSDCINLVIRDTHLEIKPCELSL